jgi:hypothetical protein
VQSSDPAAANYVPADSTTGRPTLNVDIDGDGRLDYNIDFNFDGVPDFNVGLGKANPTQSDDPRGLNYVPPGSTTGRPTLNIDVSGSGVAEFNIDLDGDGVPDVNVVDGTGKVVGAARVDLKVVVGVSQVVYTGRAQTPAVAVTGDGKALTADVDYTVAYAGNVDVGTATATVTCKGLYSGSAQASFRIVPAAVSGLKVTTSAGYAWTGKQVKPASASVRVTLGGVALKPGVDYTLSYGANKNIGKGTVKITGKGNLTGSKSVSVKIVPKSNKVSKATSAKKSVKVSWSKVSKAQKVTKYQLRYRVKDTSKWKTKTFSAKTVKSTVKKLKKGKVYQFQARSYKTVSKVKYYSAWSKTKASKKVK